MSQVYLPVEIWQEIIKYLEKPELHAISKVSSILRNASLPFLFRTARFDAKDAVSLQRLAAAYVNKRVVRKNITTLHLDYSKAVDVSRENFRAFCGVISAEIDIYFGIKRGRISRLTTLVLHEAELVEEWIQCILKCRTLRQLRLHACWCHGWRKPLPRNQVTGLAIHNPIYNRELEVLVTFLAPQLEVLEVHNKHSPRIPPDKCRCPPSFQNLVLGCRRMCFGFLFGAQNL